VGAKLLRPAFVRLLAIALVVASAGCGTAREPVVAGPAESVVAAWVILPAKELYGPVAGEGALWLRDVDTGLVFRIDPEKNALVAQIDVGRGCCLAVGEDAVWATGADTSQLLRIDPISNGLTARIRVGVFPEGLAVAFGSVWVSNRHSGTVSRVDPTTNQVIATVNVSREGAGGPNSVGRGGDSLWVGVEPRRGVAHRPNNEQSFRRPHHPRRRLPRPRNLRHHALARGRLRRCGHATQGLEASTLSPL
jgi:YVTN family beta-propeller protein